MFQPMSRALLRSTPSLRTPIHRSFSGSSRRYASSAPVDRPRSWKSSATRWGVVIAGLYYYNTGKMFAEGPASVVQLPQTDRETEIMPTVDDLATQRRQQALARQSTSTSTGTSNQAATAVATTGATSSAGSPQDLEEEAEGEGAFNPETGEINWDCPCLGGMANGPCGEQFKAAFSCFVYSKEEPKGMDCIENFKNMQDCFRQYPEVYGAELADEEDEEEEQPAQKSLSSGQPALEAGAEREGAASSSQSIAPALPKDPEPPKVIEQTPGTPTLRPEEIQQKRQRAKSAAQQVKSEHPITDETEEAVPKAWHDTRSSHDAK